MNDRLSPNSVFLSRESHWNRGRLGTRRLKLQAISGSGSGTKFGWVINRKHHSY